MVATDIIPNAADAGDAEPSPVVAPGGVVGRESEPRRGHTANPLTDGTPDTIRLREPRTITNEHRGPRDTAGAAHDRRAPIRRRVRVRFSTSSRRERAVQPHREQPCATRALPRTMSACTSCSPTWRVDCSGRRGAQGRPELAQRRPPTAEQRAAHVRSGAVATSPTASPRSSRNATGSTQKQAASRGALREHADPAAVRVAQRARDPAAPPSAFARAPPDPSVGRDDDAGADEAGAPAEVEVGRARFGARVEAAELVGEIDAEQHRRVGDAEDVAHRVVLLLVELAGLDAGERDAVAVDRQADLDEHVGPVEVDDLRADDRGVAPVGLLDQHPDRPGLDHDVVPADQEEGGSLDAREGDVAGLGEQPAAAPRRRT